MMVLSPVSRKTFKYRLYPNRQQQERLQTTLNICRELYNAGLQERIESYQTTGKGTTFNSQSAQLPDIKTIREDVGKVFSQVLQDVLHRLDKTYASFFLRVKRHQKAGFPRFKVATATTLSHIHRRDSVSLAANFNSRRLVTSKLSCIEN
jgi:putative transposase